MSTSIPGLFTAAMPQLTAVCFMMKHRVSELSTKLDWSLPSSALEAQQPIGAMWMEYYVNLFLPFGLCSFLALFNVHACHITASLAYSTTWMTINAPAPSRCQSTRAT